MSWRHEWRRARAIAWKDLTAERRSKAGFNSVVALAVTMLVMFGFALGPDAKAIRDAAPGTIWLAVLFAGVLAFNRSYQTELDGGALEQLVLYPGARRAIFAGKLLAQLRVRRADAGDHHGRGHGAVSRRRSNRVAGAGRRSLARHRSGWSRSAPSTRPWPAAAARARCLLPLLLFPMLVPVLLAAMEATKALLGGRRDGRRRGVDSPFGCVRRDLSGRDASSPSNSSSRSDVRHDHSSHRRHARAAGEPLDDLRLVRVRVSDRVASDRHRHLAARPRHGRSAEDHVRPRAGRVDDDAGAAHGPRVRAALSMEAARRRRPARRGGSRGGRDVRRPDAGARHDLGATHVGRVVDVGRATHLHARALPDPRRLPRAARARRRPRATRAVERGRRHARRDQRADRVHVRALVANDPPDSIESRDGRSRVRDRACG